MDLDVAVAHSEALDRGGALVVAEELARTFDSDLCLGFVSEGVVAEDITPVELFDAPVLKQLSKRSSTVRDLYFLLAWQHVGRLHEADVVVQSGNNPAWYVPTETQTVVRYVHSTPYAAYHRFNEVGETLRGKLYGTTLRTLYDHTVAFPDVFVANSELVARRINLYWGVPEDKIEVVYPPVEVDSYGPREQANYYFTFSHLRAEKRIDEIVRAFDGLDERLVVGGDGPERERLERLAPASVEFVGYLNEVEKRRRLGEAKALLFNARSEDFGIVPVEALASGTPVVGVREGYTQYQIDDGKNGVLYDRGTSNLRLAIRQFEDEGVAWSRERIVESANRYDVSCFHNSMREIVEEERASTTSGFDESER